MKTFSTALFWIHLAAGVTAGAVILLMSITGVLLTYERQLIEWSDRAYESTPPTSDSERLPLDALLSRVAEQRPGPAPTAVTVKADPAEPVLVAIGQSSFYADAYSGAILGQPTTGVRQAMSRLRSWHRWIALEGEGRAIGKAISGWSNLVFLFIVTSGIYLWLPRQWTAVQVRAVALFRGGLRGKARDFNWHNVIGIWSAVPLAMVVATATPISFPWANALVYRLVGEEPPAQGRGAAGPAPREQERTAADSRSAGLAPMDLNALLKRAAEQVPDWQSINVRVPATADAPVVFSIDQGNGGQPQLRSTLTLDPSSASVVRWEPFSSQSTGRRLRSWTRFTHTGEYYGLTGQTIAGLVSAGGVMLVWTGIALALRRFLRWALPGSVRRERDQDSKAA